MAVAEIISKMSCIGGRHAKELDQRTISVIVRRDKIIFGVAAISRLMFQSRHRPSGTH